MKCPKCHFENREEAKFCLECGEKFEIACPQCGKMLLLSARFFDECGHKLDIPQKKASKSLSTEDKIEKTRKYLPKGLTDIFKHTLTREVVYDSILTRGKKKLHEKVGQSIEELVVKHLIDSRTKSSLYYTQLAQLIEAKAAVDPIVDMATKLNFIRKRPIQEIVELFVKACLHWSFKKIAEGGHMAPLFQPKIINPIVREFLDSIEAS